MFIENQDKSDPNPEGVTYNINHKIQTNTFPQMGFQIYSGGPNILFETFSFYDEFLDFECT